MIFSYNDKNANWDRWYISLIDLMLKSKDLLLIHMNEKPKFEDKMRSFCRQKWSKTLINTLSLYSLIIHTRSERLQKTRVTAWLSICGPSFAEHVSVNVYTRGAPLNNSVLCLINLFPLDFCCCCFLCYFFTISCTYSRQSFFTLNFIYIDSIE